MTSIPSGDTIFDRPMCGEEPIHMDVSTVLTPPRGSPDGSRGVDH